MIESFRSNSGEIQALCAILVTMLTFAMTVYAHKALKTYKTQIIFELEIESKALAMRTFEIYLKLNLHQFHEHLLDGQSLKRYCDRQLFYGLDFVEKNNDALIRRYIVEQIDSEIEEEMKTMRITTYKVLSTFQDKKKYKSIYEYYSLFFSYYQLYKQHCSNLTALIMENHNELDSVKRQTLNEEIQRLSRYFVAQECHKRNDNLQLLMEKATDIK